MYKMDEIETLAALTENRVIIRTLDAYRGYKILNQEDGQWIGELTSSTLDNLYKKRYIEKSSKNNNTDSITYSITEKGKSIVKKHREIELVFMEKTRQLLSSLILSNFESDDYECSFDVSYTNDDEKFVYYQVKFKEFEEINISHLNIIIDIKYNKKFNNFSGLEDIFRTLLHRILNQIKKDKS